MLARLALFAILFSGCSKGRKSETSSIDFDRSTKTDDITNRASNSENKNTYPYNICDKIELVSYESKTRLLAIQNNELINNGKFMVPNVHQTLSLKGIKKDSVISMLIDFAKKPDSSSHSDCYEPHQAIVFYKQNQAIEFIEFCFSCSKIIQSQGVKIGSFSKDEFCSIEELFIKNKIDYGINLEEFYFNCHHEL